MPILNDNNIINIDKNKAGENINEYFPEYVVSNKKIHVNGFKYLIFRLIEMVFKFSIWIILKPRISKVGELDTDEVNEVYSREAIKYDKKHHLTTRGQDTVWRRYAGYIVLNYAFNNENKVDVLDICTGTGLTIKEILTVISPWGIKANIIGLDYNLNMLSVAHSTLKDNKDIVNLVRGDATNMVSNVEQTPDSDFTCFSPGSFDVITQMFGIGGISDSLSVLEQVLHLLKEHGQYFLIDMHRPVLDLEGETPIFFAGWLKMPALENYLYENCTLPLVLKRLWGWRDTTPLFYLLRLITIFDKQANTYFGFNVVSFRFEAKRWWGGLPFMPVAEIIVEKSKISQSEAENRQQILEACSVGLR